MMLVGERAAGWGSPDRVGTLVTLGSGAGEVWGAMDDEISSGPPRLGVAYVVSLAADDAAIPRGMLGFSSAMVHRGYVGEQGRGEGEAGTGVSAGAGAAAAA